MHCSIPNLHCPANFLVNVLIMFETFQAQRKTCETGYWCWDHDTWVVQTKWRKMHSSRQSQCRDFLWKVNLVNTYTSIHIIFNMSNYSIKYLNITNNNEQILFEYMKRFENQTSHLLAFTKMWIRRIHVWSKIEWNLL